MDELAKDARQALHLIERNPNFGGGVDDGGDVNHVTRQRLVEGGFVAIHDDHEAVAGPP
jgi:hypothetical protein